MHDQPSSKSLDAFLREPVGRCAVGGTHVAWCPNAEVLGSMHWGTLDDVAVRRLDDVLRLAESARLAPSCSVVVDCREVESVDVGSLAVLAGPSPAGARIGTGRHVLVVPPGPRGLLICGALVQRTCRWRIVRDQEEALASLDRDDARAAYAAATRAAASAREVSPMIVELRRDLADDVADVSVALCARRLATSVRSLQRELHRHGTSFSKELQRARVGMALDLLRHTDLKIEAIAVQSGMGCASRLSRLLRATLGRTANELRAARYDGSAAGVSAVDAGSAGAAT